MRGLREVGSKGVLAFVVAVLFFAWVMPAVGDSGSMPEDFVDVGAYIPSMALDIRYYTENNFVGERIDGYEAPKCFLTRAAADALKEVQEELLERGLSLKAWDCYRPQRAVDHFVRWAADPADQKMKATHYPGVEKETLFRDGYIAAKSSHTRGSTVDVTIIDLGAGGAEWDMGSPYDFFGTLSHTINGEISEEQQRSRLFLKSLMEKRGFKNLEEEWCHYTLDNEPYPDLYFDFPVR